MALDLSAIEAAALLGRPELPIDLEPARQYLHGKRILITGAGGSVGANLAELVLGMEPASLVLLDHHEHSLYGLYRAFSLRHIPSAAEMVLADVRNTPKMRRLLETARPEVVFHLAAYKHVPLGERFPDEVISVNVLATQALLRLCAEFGVEALAYPSSDKAVNPPSLYGATKRLTETMVQHAGRLHDRRFVVIRYVNIIGTHGSVIETLAGQIRRGEQVTITDAAMTRYWMTMAEAVWLITSASARGTGGGVYMLDAQVEVPVVEMAAHLAEQLGAAIGPERTVFTGRRPGERLREELLSSNETAQPGPLNGLVRVANRRQEQHLERIQTLLTEMDDYLARNDVGALREYVMAAAMALQ